jgi:hypothetical protein
MTILIAILAFVAGIITTSAFYRNQIREASASAAELERDVVRAAMQCGGRISALDVRSTHGRSLADVEDQLRRLHAHGYCESDVTADGQLVYVFPAFDEAPRRAVRIEGLILQHARARNGLVDVSKIAADTEISYAEARELLDRMCQAGICEPTERSDTYRFFPERQRLGSVDQRTLE